MRGCTGVERAGASNHQGHSGGQSRVYGMEKERAQGSHNVKGRSCGNVGSVHILGWCSAQYPMLAPDSVTPAAGCGVLPCCAQPPVPVTHRHTWRPPGSGGGVVLEHAALQPRPSVESAPAPLAVVATPAPESCRGRASRVVVVGLVWVVVVTSSFIFWRAVVIVV